MNRIKTIIIATAAVLITVLPAKAVCFEKENLDYEVVYHWGIIWKHAANATLSIQPNGTVYDSKLTAATRSWADKIYSVRDTLTCAISKNGFLPQKYVKIKHEGGDYGLDIVEYEYTPDSIFGHCTRIRENKPVRNLTLSSTGVTLDMMSAFYYLRTIDYAKMQPGEKITTSIFSGKRKEIFTVEYCGIENIELRDKSTYDSHKVVCTFAQPGKKKTSDDIVAWFSLDKKCIPLMVKSRLPIGEFRVYYKAEDSILNK